MLYQVIENGQISISYDEDNDKLIIPENTVTTVATTIAAINKTVSQTESLNS